MLVKEKGRGSGQERGQGQEWGQEWGQDEDDHLGRTRQTKKWRLHTLPDCLPCCMAWTNL